MSNGCGKKGSSVKLTVVIYGFTASRAECSVFNVSGDGGLRVTWRLLCEVVTCSTEEPKSTESACERGGVAAAAADLWLHA